MTSSGNAVLKATVTAQIAPADAALQVAPPPVSLPTIAPQHVAPLNAFFRPRPAVAFAVAGRSATLAAAWPPRGLAAPCCRLDITVDGDPGELTLSRSVADAIMTSLDLDQSLDAFSPAQAGILIELALSDALAALEEGLGCGLAITAARGAQAAAEDIASTNLVFALTLDGVAASAVELRLPPRHAMTLARFLDQRAALSREAVELLPVPLCLRAAAATLRVSELASLLPGDVVMLDQCCRPMRTAVAVIAEHLVAPLDLSATGAVITAPPMPGRGSSWEWSMQNVADKPDLSQKSDLDDLPINLLLELGRLDLPLGEIRRLAPGAVLPLARPLDDSVDILANGRRIGRGALVQIGDSVGVRVTRLFDNV
jgi:type III secretion protein Q